MKKIFFRTYGCQANVRDSEWVAGLLIDRGFKLAETQDTADVIIFNSCSVRKHAEDKLISNIAVLGKLKRERRHLIVGLMGCTAQLYKDSMFRKSPLLDFICGPGNESDIPSIIEGIIRGRGHAVAVDKVDAKRPEKMPPYRVGATKTFVSIMEGCDNFCSYCVVPYVRGRERSREPGDIVKEVRMIARQGFKEVTLLGQNVNSYGRVCGSRRNASGFVELLGKVDGIRGIERIRFMTSHPKDASIELFKAMRDLGKVCEHLHLPLQSASDKVLRAMNRKYTRKKYLRDVENFRKYVPGGSITTDIIVGFPGETERDFRMTRDLMHDVKFDSAFIFKYSPRPPAKSAALADDVPMEVKDARIQTLLELQRTIAHANNAALVGATLEVLCEGEGGKVRGMFLGRTRTNKVVHFPGSVKMTGKICTVKVESSTTYALKGVLE